MPARLRIVKVGGSLFDLPDLADRIRGLLREDGDTCDILIAGGGQFVDEVRRLHQTAPIDTALAHWLCIDLMSISARLLAERMDVEQVIDLLDDLPPRETSALAIFDASRWLRHCEPEMAGTKLPISWDATSDSIAARLAITLSAEELVLMKSALPTGETDLASLAEVGYVDRMLPRLAADLPPLRFVDLRNSSSLLMRGAQNQA